MIKIDDQSIAIPPYSGPNTDPLPDRKLTDAEIEEMVGRLFANAPDLEAEVEEEESTEPKP